MISIMQNMLDENTDRGTLKVSLLTTGNLPIAGATVSVSVTGSPENTMEQVTTNVDGQTEEIELSTPPVEYSLDETNIIQPYAEYTIHAEAEGYEPIDISGIQVLSGTEALQNVTMESTEQAQEGSNIVIGAHTLYGEYPPKIAEASIKPVDESGEIVLSRVVVPEYVIVHDGVPSDSTASDYYIPYKDYIKNVASSEIYPTWEESAIRANVLAIMSFTLNRVYTEWYRNKGYDFTITSSTAYDHKFIYGRNVFDSISLVVDEIFDSYLSKPNVKQPILTQYCDGKRVTCPNWMSQWGSQNLATRGRNAIEILRYYYGDTLYINEAEVISGIPSSWPGANLQIGSTGDKVRQMQEQLDRIAQVYSSIPRITADGIYGERTKEAVQAFQKIFNLPQTGVTDFATWYKISQIYVGITRIAELV